jgi:ATP-dependent helicase/nuclease subunit A
MAVETPPATAASDETGRERILTDLDTNFLVEASAGTGKTTALVRRIAALLREGKADISSIAAVTFTRKAAAHLREKLAAELDRQLAGTPPGQERVRLERARREIDRAFLGTIHSFAARLLRERPVEAGIAPDFREPDQDEDILLRDQIWLEHIEGLPRNFPRELERLGELDIDPRQLQQTYERIAEYPEVEPVHEETPRPDLSAEVGEVERFLEEWIPRFEALGPNFAPDKFVVAAKKAWRFRRNADLTRTADAAEFLKMLKSAGTVQERWGEKKTAARTAAKAATDQLREIKNRSIEPALDRWYTHRHAPAMRVILPAVREYRDARRKSARPSFTDLLLLSRNMLRDHPQVRAGFQERFPRLLVDEFQDTDPIQAELMLYLSAQPSEETGWLRLSPRAGSLFVVGDPKQSIYRFRRADIDTYNEVRRIIEASGGDVVRLSKTYRAAPAVCGTINTIFDQVFDGKVPHQAGNAPLTPTRTVRGDLLGAFRLVTSVDAKRGVCQADAHAIAGWIASALAAPLRISVREGAAEKERPVEPKDFLIILRKTEHLDLYARALEAEGIASDVAGGKAYGQSEEVRALLALLQAVADPDDPVPFVAFLRGLFCGVDDDALYKLKKGGGRFSFLSDPPAETDRRIARGIDQLREARRLAEALPPAAAIARIANSLGLFAGAYTDDGGDRRAGNLAKTLAAARRLSAQGRSFSEIVTNLGGLVENGQAGEMSIEPVNENAVRVINLHKAKGLEAPIVFLAGPHDVRGGKVPTLSIERGTDPPLGHFPVFKDSETSYAAPELARPAGWTERKKTEREYEDAEADRLLYVAATRAMNTLVVSATIDTSSKAPKESHGVWKGLLGRLEEPLPQLPAFAAAPRTVQPASTADLAGELAIASTAIEETRRAIVGASYAATSPSKFEKDGPAGPFVARERTGRGMSWGRVLHRLLEALMRDEAGPIDLARYAENLLREEERSMDEVPEVLAIVAGVRASDLWKKARAAAERFVEVPFAATVRSRDYGLPDPPEMTLLNGSIDLVFKENGVWQLIDYKSDRITGPIAHLVALYKPQLDAYRDQWQNLTREPTRAGLYFLERPGTVEWMEGEEQRAKRG